MKLSISLKFNIVFVVIFLIGLVVSGWIADHFLKQSAREETLQNARLLLDAAKSVRTYTSQQVSPLLKAQMMHQFYPQSVPSYSAVENLALITKNYPDFLYREATLNPTNLRNRATDWETDVIQKFRTEENLQEYIGERDTPSGRALFIAHPFRIKDPACLNCHSTADAAPPSMLNVYGRNNGFGWKLNEAIGAQIISVPTKVPFERADAIWHTFMLSLLGVFAFLFVALNIMVHYIVTRRIKGLAQVADQVSMGKFEADEIDTRGQDEIATLAQSFTRMRTSLSSAMKMLED